MRFLLDIETNGLLKELTKVHCIVAKNLKTGEVHVTTPGEHEAILPTLEQADELIAHNGQGFDVPALQKVYPGWKPEGMVTDTLVLSRLVWPDRKDLDFRLAAEREDFPKQLIGSHSLGAWGHRLGCHKGDYNGGWEEFSQEMLDYCVQDVEVLQKLWEAIEPRMPSIHAVELEHSFAEILDIQEQHGFWFNREKARELCRVLQGRQAELDDLAAQAFEPRVITWKTPKKKLERSKEVPFNPNSRDQIAWHLTNKYGWKPTEFTDGGKPRVDEAILSKLPYPEAALLTERLLVGKRLGQLAEGNQAWMKCLDGERIHGRVVHNGTVTGRCTHSRPNLGQVPAVGAPYGRECRELFGVPSEDLRLVGCDASGLELRMLGHYLARFDEGRFIRELLEGDIHSSNQKAVGLPTRAQAKTFIYAWLYGAGDQKIGSIVGKGRKEGRVLKRRFLEQTPGLAALKAALEEKLEGGFLTGLDGRRIPIRHEHAALNTLLQGAGAVVMKKATVLADRAIRKRLERTVDYCQVAHVHDEYQFEVKAEEAEFVGTEAVKAIEDAGSALGVRCPLAGEFKVGLSWAETH